MLCYVFTDDWSSLYNDTSVDAAADRLIFAAPKQLTAVHTVCIKKCKFPVWFSENLKC